MKYQGIIFDLDGVLCSTDRYHYIAWKQMADRIGVPFDETVNQRLRGISRKESLNIILEKSEKIYSEEEKDALAAEKNESYRSLLSSMTSDDCSDEVRITLWKLRQRGMKLAIGSSSRNAPLILERLSLRESFDAVVDGNDIKHSKPDPEVFCLAAKRLALSPSVCLVVEDAVAGIEAGTAGGFDTAALGDAARCPTCTYRLEHFRQLLELTER